MTYFIPLERNVGGSVSIGVASFGDSYNDSVESIPILQRFPWIFRPDNTRITENDPIIMSGMLMAFKGVDCIPVAGDWGFAGVVTSYEIIKFLRRASNEGVASLLRCTPKNNPELVLRRDVALPLYDLSVSNILNYMFYTKFGNVCLLQEDSLVGIISLRDIVRYAYSQLIDTGVKTGEVASRAVIRVSRDATLLDVIDLMLTRGVRRVIYEDGDERRVINDMGVIQYAFSNENLAAMRDTPEEFFSRPVEELPMVEVGVAEIGMDVAETWGEIYRSPAGCLFVEDTDMILTPWDAVIKPFLLGKLPIDLS